MAEPTPPSAPTRPDSDIVRFGGGFILIVLAMISLIGVAMAVGDISRWSRVDEWKPVTAEVTRARIKEDTGSSDARRWRPVVEFAYEVDGRRYEDDNREIVDEMTRADAEAYIDPRKPGATLEAWYDPEDHDDATLDPDPPLLRAQTIGFLVPSVLLLIYFGGWLVPAMVKKRRARSFEP